MAKTTTAPKAKKKASKATRSVKNRATATIKIKTPSKRRAQEDQATTPIVTPEQIAVRAYELWIAKGRPVGLDQRNWLEAESQLRASL